MKAKDIKVYELDEKITLKQQLWVDEYIKSDDYTTATIKAGYNSKYPKVIGYENSIRLSKFIKARKEELNAQINNNNIMELEEIQEFWTKIIKDDYYKTENRLKASELLAKSKGGFIEKHEIRQVDTDWFIEDNNNG